MASKWRREQYIPILKSKRYPKRFLFVDTETTIPEKDQQETELKLILGVCIYVELNKDLTIKKRVIHDFVTQDEFYSILMSYDRKKKRIMLVAHNTKFDIEVLDLPNILYSNGYEHEYPIENGMLFIWRCKLEKGSFTAIDTSNYVPVSLAKLGKDIGLPKWNIDFVTCTPKELRDYCLNDCMIIEKFILDLIRFLDTNDLGSFKFTMASQAFTSYRYRFMTTPPFTIQLSKVLRYERNTYFGGRTECFMIGEIKDEPLYYLDINSAYPYAMKSKKIPYEFLGQQRNPPLYHLKNMINVSYVIAHVTLTNADNAFPFKLSDKQYMKQKRKNKDANLTLLRIRNRLLFPIGNPTVYLQDIELQYALENDMIDEVHYMAWYKYSSLFDEYIDFFYEMKKQATIDDNKVNRQMAKLYMNTLYGKFGQRNYDTIKIEPTPIDGNETIHSYDFNTQEKGIIRRWFNFEYHIKTEGEATYSVPVIAGGITAITRMNLYNFMLQAGKENVFYCDTDSIIVNQEGYDRLQAEIHPTRLGALDLEKSADYLKIYGNKDYEFGDEIRHKGLPQDNEEISEGVFQYEQFEGFRTWVKRGGTGNPKVFLRTKTRKGVYSKGVDDGHGNISPYFIQGYRVIL